MTRLVFVYIFAAVDVIVTDVVQAQAPSWRLPSGLDAAGPFDGSSVGTGGYRRLSHDTYNSHNSGCNLSSPTGPCRAHKMRFAYRRMSGDCQAFVYGGCRGNSNNFHTIESCRETCMEKKAAKNNHKDEDGLNGRNNTFQ
jgi:hypothetical protein